ncbi:MAG TPA: hypothetical protein PLW88_04550 [Syntrophorhabdaceae bacterium]|nr:hypothetical protein [Syntrophorhabdaceae bacterium]HPP06618.1 hypothetical protein [Syntrophorhabdaceae bacterium]
MKKILLADRDEGLKDAFRVVFPTDEYEFFYTSDGASIERIALEYKPNIYIINVDLDKKDGIEVYEDLQERELLRDAHFFFLKDINKKIDLSGYTDIRGVIEKPINFFKVHQMIAELEDLGEKANEPETLSEDLKTTRVTEETGMIMKEILKEPKVQFKFEDDKESMAFEEELKKAIIQCIETLREELIEKLTPVVSNYMKNYSKQILTDIAEKVIREELETLLASIRKSR